MYMNFLRGGHYSIAVIALGLDWLGSVMIRLTVEEVTLERSLPLFP